MRLIGMHLGPRTYWSLGWLLTIVAIYVGTQIARSLGVLAAVVPGGVAVVVGVVLAGLGLIIARRFRRRWVGVAVGGLGIVSVGLGLVNLVR